MASKPVQDLTTNELLGKIVETLEINEEHQRHLPGLLQLLKDYLSSSATVLDIDFHRRMLRVFRDAPQDQTYQHLVAEMEPEEQDRVEKFVADGRSPEECGQGFEKKYSLGVREHLRAMLEKDVVVIRKILGRDRDSSDIEGDEPGHVHIAGLSTAKELSVKDGVLHKFVHGLAGVFGCGLGQKVVEKVFPDEVFVYRNIEFENWGQNQKHTPAFTCIPSSVAAVQRIVKYAKQEGMGVRCAGFRHSWSPIFGRNGQVLISLLGLHEATKIPNTTAWSFLPEDSPTQLESIEVVGPAANPSNTLVRIGVSCTNERLRRWCVDNKRYTLPLNVIMVEMTIGGTNGPICHGAGRDHPTLSDLVRKIEYVDANGSLRTVDDPRHLRAASGAFGMMGVITHLTLELEPMSYALMHPTKLPVVRAVPPPPGMPESEIPVGLRLEKPLTAEEKAEDQRRFEQSATSDYYCEWFWFPLSDECWVNNWNTTPEPAGAEDYPSAGVIFFSFVSQLTMNVLQFTPALGELIDILDIEQVATVLISRAAMMSLPAPSEPIKTYIPEALHFQRGIQNVRVLNVEVEIPLVAVSEDRPQDIDWAIVQRAWWEAIKTCYRHVDTCPQRMPLEMRIMGGSDVVLAPQRHNNLGTCAIEILTLRSRQEQWHAYAQEVLDQWMALRDRQGKKLGIRPHWAKQWQNFKVDGKLWQEKLKTEDYREEVAEFKTLIAEIGKEHGWTLADLKERFSNEWFDYLVFDDVEIK